jgi:hypothetical protein
MVGREIRRMSMTNSEDVKAEVERLEYVFKDPATVVKLDDLRTILSALTASEQARDEAREALKPFADAYGRLTSRWEGHESDWHAYVAVCRVPTVADLRRAAKIVKPQNGDA